MAPATLSVVSTSKFAGFSDGNILHWCPTLNLLTISMNITSLWVYRLNGERVYSVNNRSPIKSIATFANGAYFCLSGSDGRIKIHDSNNGNLVKTIEKPFSDLALVHWSHHDVSSVERGRFSGLFTVDILGKLPKLSTSVEQSQSQPPVSTEIDIHELNNANGVNFLVIVDSQGISINFNNLLTVTDIQFPTPNMKVLAYLDNNDLFNQFFVAQTESGHQLVQLNDNLSSTSNRSHLVDLILKICKIVAILNHTKEHLAILQTEIKPFFVVYDRYLSNLSESLGNKDKARDVIESDLSNCLHEMLLTNLIPPGLKDYWINQFGERGYKRLNKLGNSVYDLSRNVIFKTLIASIERLLVLLNKLKSLSQWFRDSENPLHSGLNFNLMNELIGQSKVLLKLFYKAIWDINQEQKAFNHFMTWVKREIIDKITKEDDIPAFLSQPNQPDYNHSELISYINNSLFNSNLWKYLQLDLSSNEVLISNNCALDLGREFDSLDTKVTKDLVETFKQLIKNTLQVKVSRLDLNLPEDLSDLRLKTIDESSSVLCTLSHSRTVLELIRFSTDLDNGFKQTRQIQFEAQVINYEFKNSSEIVVLIQDGTTYEVVVFNFVNAFTVDDEVIEFPQFERIGVLTNSQINLKAPKSLAISRNDSRSYGCLLDSNKQDYVVFVL